MGLEWLNQVVEILTAAGIPADEAFPAEAAGEITGVVAAVGLSGLDCAAGEATVTVSILSPRKKGGWTCQTGAVEGMNVLEAAGIRCQMGRMEYRPGCDCYCVEIQGTMSIQDDGNTAAGRWEIRIDGQAVEWVTEFTGYQDQGRRLIGSTWQSAPVGVTNGTGGWEIRMVQQIPWNAQEADDPGEPFTLVLREARREQTYTGCCWNSVERVRTSSGTKITRQGFALTREVTDNG